MIQTDKHLRSERAALLLLCGLLSCVCIAQQRTGHDAKSIASSFAINKLKESRHKGEIKLLLSSSQVSTNEELRTDKEAYYIFSSTENDEFIIVSGDERMPSILAYSDENDFDNTNIPPNVLYWLERYTDAYLSLDDDVYNAKEPLSSINPNGVKPLLANNRWGQDNPYNLLCPTVRNKKCVTGCVATAMAQVMNYYKYPNIGKGNISYWTETNNINVQHRFDEKPFLWDNIIDDYSKGYSSEQATAIAELMLACGASVKMDYCVSSQGGSGAYQSDLIPAFIEHFDYDRDAAFVMRDYCSSEDWHQLIINELNNGSPINYAGQSYRDGGHSFVLDGYSVDDEYTYPYYHINWGWDGVCNGYYQIVDLHPVENGQYASNGGFNEGQEMLVGIKPEDGIDNPKNILCTSKLNLSTTIANPGKTVKIQANSVINMSYEAFNGTLHVALIPMNDSTEIISGEVQTKSIGYLQEQKDLNIEFNVPIEIPDGQYLVQLRSVKGQGKECYPVFSKQYPSLTITSNNDINQGQEPEEEEVILGASELEIIQTEDSSTIKLRVYELANLQGTTFVGYLRMGLGDSEGNILTMFGDSAFIEELNEHEIQNTPLIIKGIPQGSWPDGEYRLLVLARNIDSPCYHCLAFHDITKPNIINEKLFVETTIKEGYMYVNGHRYILPSTSIATKLYNDDKKYIATKLSGIQGTSHPYNLFDIIIIDGKKHLMVP